MKCRACEHANDARAKFCEECGAHLERVCVGCGAELTPAANFCPQCGARSAEMGATGHVARLGGRD